MKFFALCYKITKRLYSITGQSVSKVRTLIKLRGNGVKYQQFRTNGVPYVMISRGGEMKLGNNFAMNNGINGNPIGCYEKCTFFVGPNGKLIIGNNVGISQAALIAIDDITIGNDVKIGGGVQVFTTDFHSLDPLIRKTDDDIKHRKTAPVVICDNAFIGARSMILKGVTIGENSIIAAGSVVTKSIPANQIWGGNPAKFIRNI